jgi:hypothetical protein
MAKMTYEQWKQQVNQEVQTRTGMAADDLDDWRYTDDYRDGMSPKRSAARAIKNAKEACGC